MKLTPQQCQQARLSRDPRFDGQFFTAVKTTGIFCRPICPAAPPNEENVEYFAHSTLALKAGYRPCLRCRPESAPGSNPWQGTETTFQRAIRLIDGGALRDLSLSQLSEKCGISDRYLRKLFNTYLGMSPKYYAQLNQVMFAKQLLHSSNLPVTSIALASGFNSVRRFNDAFQKLLRLTPSQVKKGETHNSNKGNQILIKAQGNYNWDHMLEFYRLRLAHKVESIESQQYKRTFQIDQAQGWFSIQPTTNNQLLLRFSISDFASLNLLIKAVKRMFDTESSIQTIDHAMRNSPIKQRVIDGIRIPGVLSPWEAGVRAILGQQVSVKAAMSQLNTLVEHLGQKLTLKDDIDSHESVLFPTPNAVFNSSLEFLKMPNARKETLRCLAKQLIDNPQSHPDQWLSIKGIGPWSVAYAKMRGLSDPNQFLHSDLIIKKAMESYATSEDYDFSPWGSYATLQIWNTNS